MCYVHVAALVAEYLTRKGMISKPYFNTFKYIFSLEFEKIDSFLEEVVDISVFTGEKILTYLSHI